MKIQKAINHRNMFQGMTIEQAKNWSAGNQRMSVPDVAIWLEGRNSDDSYTAIADWAVLPDGRVSPPI